MNEARTAEEYKRQKYAEKRKETAKERNRDNRRYESGGVRNNYLIANNSKNRKDADRDIPYESAEDKRKRVEHHLDNYYKSAASHCTGGNTLRRNRSKLTVDNISATDDAIERHNRRHPDRKLESGIFGVTY
jgi:hypothetical protein